MEAGALARQDQSQGPTLICLLAYLQGLQTRKRKEYGPHRKKKQEIVQRD